MVRLLIRYTFRLVALSVLAAFILTPCEAQTDSLRIYIPDSTFFQRKMEADSIRMLREAEEDNRANSTREKEVDTTSRFGLVLSVDYGKLATLATNFESKYEGAVGLILFRRWVVEAVYGAGELNPNGAYKNTEYYTINGTYYKGGLQYRFILNPAIPREFLYLGVSYAMAEYEDEGKFLIGSDLWDNYEQTFGSNNLQADWTEFYLITEAYLNKRSQRFLIGLKVSLRIMNNFENREDIPVYSIPGYGRTFDKSVPSLNFFLKYKLPF